MQMARETGRGFLKSKKQSIGQILGVIEDEQREQYSIGYVPDEPVRISEFRKLSVATTRKELVVQARDRYWAKRKLPVISAGEGVSTAPRQNSQCCKAKQYKRGRLWRSSWARSGYRDGVERPVGAPACTGINDTCDVVELQRGFRSARREV